MSPPTPRDHGLAAPLAWTKHALLALAVLFGAAGCSCSGDPEGGGGGTPCDDDTDCTGGDRCNPVDSRCIDPDDPAFCAPELNLCGCGDAFDDGCESAGIGPKDRDFDLDDNDTNGVGKNPEGQLFLDSTEVNTRIIWIANTSQGTVSKVDTTTFEELARYQTTPLGITAAGDPSRTSVNLFSDVYVANRRHGSVTKISVLGDGCPDKNGDGVVNTSTGPSDIKPWVDGEPTDECILWYTKLPDKAGWARAAAAQEVVGLDGALESNVWIGGWSGWVYKLDGETGDILVETPSPVAPYGFALDKGGNLWIATVNGPTLGRIDTTRCIDDTSCADPVCTNDMGEAGDDCVKQIINRDDSGGSLYGITVDYKQRVWVGGNNVGRYDHSAPWGSRWQLGRVNGQSLAGAGIGATKKFAFLSFGGQIAQFDLEDPSSGAILSNIGGGAYGIAIDLDGKVWGIPHDGSVSVITPGDNLGEFTASADPPRGFVEPYTYSDMTGSQVRFATNPRGYYRERFDGCGGKTNWGELRYSVDTPAGTSVVFRARTANTVADLGGAEFVNLAYVPPDQSPANLAEAFDAAGVTLGNHLEVEVQLISETPDSNFVTPTVSSFAVTRRCAGDVF